jgi:hypothetical protein
MFYLSLFYLGAAASGIYAGALAGIELSQPKNGRRRG